MSAQALIIFDGSEASLIAAWIESCERVRSRPGTAIASESAGRPVLFVTVTADHFVTGAAGNTAPSLCDERAFRCGELCEAEIIHDAGESVQGDLPPGVHETRLLLRAGMAALQRGCGRVVWPVVAPDRDARTLDRVSEVTDRAMLVGRLLSLDAEAQGLPGIVIETPFADLEAWQVRDLGRDVDTPLSLMGGVVTQPIDKPRSGVDGRGSQSPAGAE
jgi:hypothetical protein